MGLGLGWFFVCCCCCFFFCTKCRSVSSSAKFVLSKKKFKKCKKKKEKSKWLKKSFNYDAITFYKCYSFILTTHKKKVKYLKELLRMVGSCCFLLFYEIWNLKLSMNLYMNHCWVLFHVDQSTNSPHLKCFNICYQFQSFWKSWNVSSFLTFLLTWNYLPVYYN